MVYTDYESQLVVLRSKGNYRSLSSRIPQGKYVIAEDRTLLNLSSNDYLGLASDPLLRQDFEAWVGERFYPLSASSSRLLAGNYPVHRQVERQLATLFGREDALLFNSGYHANMGILPALANKRSLIVADRLVHASLIDGMRLADAPHIRFRHQDLDQLEHILVKESPKYERIFIVTESLFSMDGDITDLTRLVALKRSYPRVLLYVDEAHAFGCRGSHGLGIAEEQGCIPDIDLLIGTFGKALASMGAFVVCSSLLREYLINTARPFIFSTALPPYQVAWTSFLLEHLATWGDRRVHLATISHQLAQALYGEEKAMRATHILPWVLGDNATCLQVARELDEGGFYCLPIRTPTVPAGSARIRFSLSADMTERDIATLSSLIQHMHRL